MSRNKISKARPISSVAKNAHGIRGTLSKIKSGNGGYFSMSGTRSCTTVNIKLVHRHVRNKYIMLTSVFRFSPL